MTSLLHADYLEPRLVRGLQEGLLRKQVFIECCLTPMDGPILDTDGEVKTCMCGDALDANDPEVQDEPLKKVFVASYHCGHVLHSKCAMDWYSNYNRCPDGTCGVNQYDTDLEVSKAFEVAEDLICMDRGLFDGPNSRNKMSDNPVKLRAPQLRHSTLLSAYYLLVTGDDPSERAQHLDVGMAASREGRTVVQLMLDVIDSINLSYRSVLVLREQIPTRIMSRMPGIKEMSTESWLAVHNFAEHLTTLALHHYAAGSSVLE
ncbi:hypothetical protein HII31_06555 [Pseudocercospora fuligena]|uniref:WDR59/RTC1-like RING zinc finger domain-containing protein n=1 Tax=Pseudocercospora fuligena TaxID=685502 RepID=A0A8H6RJI6_9PEZI|nr:hypothetical protein HII31_06555 [Pseudocercospora fuligena]